MLLAFGNPILGHKVKKKCVTASLKTPKSTIFFSPKLLRSFLSSPLLPLNSSNLLWLIWNQFG